MVVEINDAIIPFAFIWFVCAHFWHFRLIYLAGEAF